ncbi:MAG: ABC transporter permease [Christensenella sp.]|uniref:ABC transporter permease n=1 Tax=Christensenella sp. TaxID=1935934 RepID=UPI002B1F321D|nr:ABC transporter permease [Christensenella sp.]MEA5003603.1 ABC transporter permease [Christensenella sp.]
MSNKQSSNLGSSKWSVIRVKYRTELAMGIIMVAFFIMMCFLTENFRTAQNLSNVASQVAIIAILSIGQTFVMLTGGIDLSVGGTLGISSMSMAITMVATQSMAAGIMVGIGVGLLVGCINGFLVSYMRIPAFITTLGMSMITRGADYLISNGRSVSKLVDGFDMIAKAEIVPYVRVYYVAIVVLFIVMAWCLNNTKLGRYIYAIGSNSNAARLAGVNVKSFRMYPYIISGLMAAVGAILMSSRLMGVDSTYGANYEMDTLAAVVIGGVAMTGGKGTLIGTAIGVVFMGLVKNGLDLLGVSPYWQTVTVGIIIIAALLIESISSMVREKKKATVA